MSDQLAIDVPTDTPDPRPVLIPPNAPRCWIAVEFPEEIDGDWGYPDETHYPSAEAAAKAGEGLAAQLHLVRLPFVCVEAHCVKCRHELMAHEYWSITHFPSWAEAERVAKCDNWKIGPRGEFVCPNCREADSR